MVNTVCATYIGIELRIIRPFFFQIKTSLTSIKLTFFIASESLIGIHCTHGLNRTGYMVCRYMRDRLGFPAKDAIKSKLLSINIDYELFITSPAFPRFQLFLFIRQLLLDWEAFLSAM